MYAIWMLIFIFIILICIIVIEPIYQKKYRNKKWN